MLFAVLRRSGREANFTTRWQSGLLAAVQGTAMCSLTSPDVGPLVSSCVQGSSGPIKKVPDLPLAALSAPCFHLTPKTLLWVARSEAVLSILGQKPPSRTPAGASGCDLEATSNHRRIPVLDWNKPPGLAAKPWQVCGATEFCNFGASSPYLQFYRPPPKHSALQNQSTRYSEIHWRSLQASLVKWRAGRVQEWIKTWHSASACEWPLPSPALSGASGFIARLQATRVEAAFLSLPWNK